MTITHVYTYTVTDRTTLQERGVAIGVENGRFVYQGPRSWDADEATVDEFIAGCQRVRATLNGAGQRES